MACIHLLLTTCILRIVMFITITLDIEIIFISMAHSDLYAKSFYCSSILIWNEIMNKIEVSISFPQFKILLKHYLLVNSLKK